jgi:hypothetical protein
MIDFFKTSPFSYYNNILQSNGVPDYFRDDPLLNEFNLNFNSTIVDIKLANELLIFNFPPKSTYNWHKDSASYCSLNMVFEEYDTYSIWSDLSINSTEYKFFKTTDVFVECKYTPFKWTLINGKSRHMVLHHGNNFRYLLTFIIKNQDYNTVLTWLKQKDSVSP